MNWIGVIAEYVDTNIFTYIERSCVMCWIRSTQCYVIYSNKIIAGTIDRRRFIRWNQMRWFVIHRKKLIDVRYRYIIQRNEIIYCCRRSITSWWKLHEKKNDLIIITAPSHSFVIVILHSFGWEVRGSDIRGTKMFDCRNTQYWTYSDFYEVTSVWNIQILMSTVQRTHFWIHN